MIAELDTFLSGLLGQPCCRQHVGRDRSLSIGFGIKIEHGRPTLPHSYYGEWELGTYSAAWRIVREEGILCGSHDAVDNIAELNAKLQTLRLGPVERVVASSSFDIRVILENGLSIDFFCAASDDDEMFHIFGPDRSYAEFSVVGGWKLGASDTPWK